jgi:hypothetical protein
VNRSDAFLASDRFPVIPGGGQDAWLRTGFARIGWASASAATTDSRAFQASS